MQAGRGSLWLLAVQPPGGLLGPVGQDNACTRPANSHERFEGDGPFVEPAARGGRFDHAVLAGDVVRGDRHAGKVLAYVANDIEVGQGRLDHNHVRAFGQVELHFPDCLASSRSRIHLVAMPAAELRRTFGRIAKRAIERAGVLGGVTHDRNVREPSAVETTADRADHAIHHTARGDQVRASLGMTNSLAGEQFERSVVVDIHATRGIVDDAAVAVTGVLAKANIGNDQQVRRGLFGSRDSRLHDAVLGVGVAAGGVLFVRDTEQNHAAQAKLGCLRNVLCKRIWRKLELPRHRVDRPPQVLAGADEEWEHEVGRPQLGLTDQLAHCGMVPQSTQADSRKTVLRSGGHTSVITRGSASYEGRITQCWAGVWHQLMWQEFAGSKRDNYTERSPGAHFSLSICRNSMLANFFRRSRSGSSLTSRSSGSGRRLRVEALENRNLLATTQLPIGGTFVQFNVEYTSSGQTQQEVIPVQMFDSGTPQTVANFLKYVNDGDYNNSIFHRYVENFVLQGGNLKANGTPIPTDPAVQNEPVFSNVRGTMAMAKLPTDPNSATSQYFFNLKDNNQGTAEQGNLDLQNGGFTAFAKVVGGGMDALNRITAKIDESGEESVVITSVTVVAPPWKNPDAASGPSRDVNDDGQVNMLDALTALNRVYQNLNKSTPVQQEAVPFPTSSTPPAAYWDVTGDNAIDMNDASNIINHILSSASTAQAMSAATDVVNTEDEDNTAMASMTADLPAEQSADEQLLDSSSITIGLNSLQDESAGGSGVVETDSGEVAAAAVGETETESLEAPTTPIDEALADLGSSNGSQTESAIEDLVLELTDELALGL